MPTGCWWHHRAHQSTNVDLLGCMLICAAFKLLIFAKTIVARQWCCKLHVHRNWKVCLNVLASTVVDDQFELDFCVYTVLSTTPHSLCTIETRPVSDGRTEHFKLQDWTQSTRTGRLVQTSCWGPARRHSDERWVGGEARACPHPHPVSGERGARALTLLSPPHRVRPRTHARPLLMGLHARRWRAGWVIVHVTILRVSVVGCRGGGLCVHSARKHEIFACAPRGPRVFIA